jgi:uncharacterized membrane protein
MHNEKEGLVKKILDNDQDLKACNIDENLIHELISGKVSKNINETQDENLTLGQRTADKIAAFGGSWPFIIIFGIILFGWIALNTVILMKKAFDPYPFVFLNLVLSCLAAVQAPVIMMAQNRQTEKDRLTAANDYLVNLKSEIIIEDLHKKIDVLMYQHEENKKMQESLLKIVGELKSKKIIL